jgi:hypothetical protein
MDLDDEFGELEGTLAVLEMEPSEEPEEYYPTLKVWKDAGRAIEKAHGEVRWKIGDWLLAGEKQFGKKAYKEAVAITGYAKATLYDIARVAKRVTTSVRTEDLSWNHHRAVEKLEDREVQKEWLRQAHAADFSVDALKRAIKRQPLPGHPPKHITSNKGDGEQVRYLKVRLIEADIKVAGKLAEARKLTPGELLSEIVVRYLRSPETGAEIERAEIVARDNTAENRIAGREKREKETIQSINALLERYSDLPGSTMPDPGDFVTAWEKENGRKFPFGFAMKHTEFSAHYHGISAEDAGCGEYSQFEKHEDE